MAAVLTLLGDEGVYRFRMDPRDADLMAEVAARLGVESTVTDEIDEEGAA